MEDFNVEFPVYIDPGKRSYDAFDMKRGLLATVNVKSFFRMRSAQKRGYVQAENQGDPLQNGGVVIVAPGGEVRYIHIESTAGDLADLDEVIAALG